MLIHSASQLLTLAGGPQRGKALGSLGVIPNGAVVIRDEKIIAVPSSHLTLRYENVFEYTQLPDITVQQIKHFFEHYKDLEPGKWVKVFGWGDSKRARELIVEAIERAKAAK